MNKLTKQIKKYKGWIILGAIILVVIGLSKQPVFFDSFGIGVFIFILASSAYMIINKKYPEWILYVYLIIGSSGLIIDGINILKG